MNFKKKFKNSLREIETPSPERVLGASAVQNTSTKRKKKSIGRFSFAPALSVFLCIVLVGCTAAVGIPILINYMNARALTDNLEQLDTVPEGYIGIYTADDLDNVRNAPNENYILMSDINFSDADFLEGGRFEGGWIPIGSDNYDGNGKNLFSGIFNGNGYVIRNVKVAGAEFVKMASFGIFGETKGQFINLGVEGIFIDVDFCEADFYTDAKKETVFVGGIAASADFIGGCYVNDAEINISLENYFHGAQWEYRPSNWTEPCLFVGGIAGTVDYLDSCIADADISVIGEKDFTVCSGLLSGDAFSVITSITSGNLSVDGAECKSVSVDRIASLSGGVSMPSILNETAIETIVGRIEEYYREERKSDWNSGIFRAYYVKLSASHDDPTKIDTRRIYREYMEINQMFGYVNIDAPNYDGDLYILDRNSSGADTMRIAEIVREVFGSFDAFLEFCNENNIKCGVVNCYSFNAKEDINAKTLENFDFENIFAEKDGKVILRIFDN